MDKAFDYGDWVVYECGDTHDIGRVANWNRGGVTFVCYSYGCTGSASRNEYLRHATQEEIEQAIENEKRDDGHIGFHRFDDTCDSYSGGLACSYCIHHARQGKDTGDYVDDKGEPVECPECGSDNIYAGPFVQDAPGYVIRSVECDGCGCEWLETFHYSDMEMVHR